jgi:hypothetical protein
MLRQAGKASGRVGRQSPKQQRRAAFDCAMVGARRHRDWRLSFSSCCRAMPSELLWIHASGVCALALNVVALVHTCEKTLRIQSGLAGVIWALNNLLLGAHTAAALSLVSAGRTATSAVTLSAREGIRRAVFAAFLLLTLLIGALTWHGWPSLLMVLASVLSTFAVFYLRGRALRLTMLLVSALWMYNAWLYDSWEQMAANVITAVAALVGARRVERAIEDAAATGGCKPGPAAASS